MNNYEEICLKDAVKFAAVRGKLVNRTRQEFDTLQDAQAYASCFGDRRTMIYAITEMGNNAHICNA